MIKLKNILTEEVYGNKATVYHRTRVEDLFNLLFTDGFKAGMGDMYGSGVYTTYEPTNKISDNATNYGSIQVKFAIDLIDFFIFDWDEYEKHRDYRRKVEQFNKETSTKSNFIIMQMRYYKVPDTEIVKVNKKFDLDDYDKYYEAGITSDMAYFLFNSIRKVSYSVNGIIFTGRRDGKVLVCYNPVLIVPLSSYDDYTGEIINLKNVDKATFKEYFKKYINNKNKISNSQHNKLDILIKKYMLQYDADNDCYDSPSSVFLDDDIVSNGKFVIKFGIINGHFDCSYTSLKTLEGSPRHVNGNFSVESCKKLRSLKGSPDIVDGDFYILGCISLGSLEGSPNYVGGIFDCSDTYITSLEGAPNEVGKSFICSKTNITSLKGSPKFVNGTFDCSGCKKLITLEDGPVQVSGDYFCKDSGITSLKGAPEHIDGAFDCSKTKITSLYGSPEVVVDEFDCSNTRIKTLEGSPKKVGGNFTSFACYEMVSLKGAPESVGESFNVRYNTALKSLEYAPKEVRGSFICNHSGVTSLNPLLKCTIGGDIYVSDDMEDIEIPDKLRRKIEFY